MNKICLTAVLLLLAPISYAEQSLLAELPVVPVCYNYGCKTQTHVRLQPEEWDAILRIFDTPAETPRIERARIRQTVMLMERFMGGRTPIHRDKGKNADPAIGGQMDCIDESRNTDAYLRVLNRYELLTWHRLHERVLRIRWVVFQHWGAQIEDIMTGQRYIVDSWYLDSGEPPYIQKLKDWKKKRPFPPQDDYQQLVVHASRRS